MNPVSVCGLHNHVISTSGISRILQNGLIQITHISGKHQFLCHVVLTGPYFNAGRSQQMPYISKTDLNSFADPYPLSVLTRHKQFYGIQRILHGIYRLILRFSCPFSFSVAPLRLKFLNMRTVPKHDITQVSRGKCSKYLPLKPFFYKPRKHAGMINMGMRQKHIVNFLFRNGQARIFIQVRALLHSAVDQDIFPCCLQEMTASRNFMGCSDKSKLHMSHQPFSLFFYCIISCENIHLFSGKKTQISLLYFLSAGRKFTARISPFPVSVSA